MKRIVKADYSRTCEGCRFLIAELRRVRVRIEEEGETDG